MRRKNLKASEESTDKKVEKDKVGGDVENKTSSVEEMFEGSIKLEMPSVSKLSVRKSGVVNIANFNWEVILEKQKLNNVDYLGVYACCNSKSVNNLWSCSASIEFKLFPANDKTHEKKCYAKCLSSTFNQEAKKYGDKTFITWDALTSTELGYLKDDQLTIVAHITLKKIVGVYNSMPVDFLTEETDITDGVLNVDGKQLHVSKTFLAMYSPVFRAMFFSSFSESSQKEIVLTDVKFDEFTEMLKVIYPMRKPVDAANVDYLLRLADQFDVRCVMRECERYLMNTKYISIAKKLLYAEKYILSNLQESCLKKMMSAVEVKEIKESAEYSQMGAITKNALFEKLLTFV